MPSTMKQWQLAATGRNNLNLVETAVPVAGPGEVLVKAAAVSLNYRDKLAIDQGFGIPAFPFVPASDLAGTVVACGPGTQRFSPGDRVISTFEPGWIDGAQEGSAKKPSYRTLGGEEKGVLAEYVTLPADWLVHAPSSLDAGEASTLPVAGLTAWSALAEYGGVRPGQTVLVQGTGGVSLFGLQIARAAGASVIVTSSSDEKLERAKTLGATHGINRRTHDWVEAVYELTGGRGVDHILEVTGGANLGRSVDAIAVRGRISVIGVFDGFEFSGPTGPLLRKSPVIQGIAVGHRRALEDFTRMIGATGLKPVIDRRYGFAEAGAAFEHLERGPFGKVVIEVAPSGY